MDTPLPIVGISELDNLSQDVPTVQPNQVQLRKVLDIEAPANILALAAEVIFRVWHFCDIPQQQKDGGFWGRSGSSGLPSCRSEVDPERTPAP